jgi:hypothetical protein
LAAIEPAERQRITAFLQALDQKSRRKATFYVIGGAAVTLAYAPDNRTADIDVIEATEEVVALGGKDSDLAQEFGVYISPLDEITFAAPAGWKARCEPLDVGLKKLSIKTADRYDIVLGKTARFEPRDIEDIRAIQVRHRLDPVLLLDRLNSNLDEIKNFPSYRHNCALLFELLGRPIVFRSGKAKFVK